jgi:hypothetical protein
MVMRYVHPGEAHRTEAVQKLELANAAKEIAEVEKKKASDQLRGADRIRTDA